MTVPTAVETKFPPPLAMTLPPPEAITLPPPEAITFPPPDAITLPPPDAMTFPPPDAIRSEEHTSELQSRQYLVCRLLLEKKKKSNTRSAKECEGEKRSAEVCST